MPTYEDSIVAVGRLLRPKAGEPRIYSVAAVRQGETRGKEIIRQVLTDRKP
jgi:hypothetical protein